MIPDLSQILLDYYHSLLSPVPRFLRGWVVVGSLFLVFWSLGGFADDTSDEALGRAFQGISVTKSGFDRVTEASSPIIASGAVKGGSSLFRVGKGAMGKGSDLVEVEEAPVKIGPLVHIHGIKIGLFGLLIALVGGIWAFPEMFPFLP